MADTQTIKENEVTLFDILRIIWKWRFLIGGGVVAFGIASILISFTLKKIYNISMIVQPGIISTDDSGKRVFIDTVETIAGRIEAEIYSDEIMDSVFKGKKEHPDDIQLKIKVPKLAEVIHVSYESANTEEGISVLQELFKQLQNHEKRLVTQIKEKFNRKIELSRIELEKRKGIEQSCAENIRNLERSIQDARSDIHLITKNNVNLTQERKKLIDKNTKDEKALAVLLYSNTIQQNIQFVNNVNKDLNDKLRLKEEELQKIIHEQNEQLKLIGEIQLTERQRDSISPIAMIRKPVSARNPVKPRKYLIISLALVAGFFIMSYISYMIEYIRANRGISNREL
ncbi:MAG: Wzz/FepE/Etk N-terminal domain-containing protein [Desulfobacteraceae bacterium]|jgi:LPS O-antigen subunit length determinant protein (WzzB/FepE family)